MNINFEKLFLLENLTNHIPLGLIFISPEKKIDFINKKAESFLQETVINIVSKKSNLIYFICTLSL